MAMIYCRESIQCRISRGERSMGEVWRHEPPVVSPSRLRQNVTIPLALNYDHTQEILSTQGSLGQTQCLRILLGTCHMGTSAWSLPKFQTPEGNMGSAETKIFWINSLVTVSHYYQGTVGTLLKPRFPDASKGPILQLGYSKIVSGLLCELLLHKGCYHHTSILQKEKTEAKR